MVTVVDIQQAIFSLMFLISFGLIAMTKNRTVYSYFSQYLPWLSEYTGFKVQLGLALIAMVSIFIAAILPELRKQDRTV